MEEEEEEVSVSHFIHEHPLTLLKSDKISACYGCGRLFMGEAAYGCKKCGNKNILHEECVEMPREIRHPDHPQHTLLQKQAWGGHSCAVCELKIWQTGYFCSNSGCEFRLHLRCTPSVGLENVSDKQICMQHPSHPQHLLTLLRKRHTFKCDACGIMETGRSYICLLCQYCIHERCAVLPTINTYHHHHHPLSLAFQLPPQYSKFFYKCDVCGKELLLNRWIYHCEICRYIVHIKCAVKQLPLPNASNDREYGVNGGGLIQFPFSDVNEEVIKPFVIREKGEMIMPQDDHQKYTFSQHPHQLILVSSYLSEADDGDDDTDSRQVPEIIYDGCTMPIFLKVKHDSSSSSSNKNCNNYMSCGECKYFLHVACFNLPPKLSSHPLHNKVDHTLNLEASQKLNFQRKCSICKLSMNGLFYSCTECSFKADIKCTSLPKTIKHRAHPQHPICSEFLGVDEYIEGAWHGYCSGCHLIIYWGLVYKCGSCNFSLCESCMMLPAVNQHEAEKHTLPLRYDVYLNHPDDFCCDACEREIDPKDWMYHCRYCETFFHTSCFPTMSGEFRNLKFGFQCNIPPALHPHPLTFGLLTTKLRCDVCGLRVYGEEDVDQRGFHCSSCNFFMCWTRCGRWRLDAISIID